MPKDYQSPNGEWNSTAIESLVRISWIRVSFVIGLWSFGFQSPEPLPSFLRAAEGIVAPAHRSGQARQPRRRDRDVNPGDNHVQQPGEQQSDEIEPIETIEQNPPTHQESAGQLGRLRHAPA